MDADGAQIDADGRHPYGHRAASSGIANSAIPRRGVVAFHARPLTRP